MVLCLVLKGFEQLCLSMAKACARRTAGRSRAAGGNNAVSARARSSRRFMPCNSSNGYPHDCEFGQWSCAISSNTAAARVASMAIIIDAVFLQSGFT